MRHTETGSVILFLVVLLVTALMGSCEMYLVERP